MGLPIFAALGTVAFLFRQVTRGHIAEIIYREMPNTRELLALCEGIYLMRMEARLTALKDEVRLFENLIKVFRAPSILLRMTGQDCIHSSSNSNANVARERGSQIKLKQD